MAEGIIFVKKIPDDYQCVICAMVLNEPHLTDCCGQHFCQACLEQWFEEQAKKICPHCRSETFTHMRYLPLKRKIDDLEVYCPYLNEGCKEIIKLGALDAHKNICGFTKVTCTQRCGKFILRKNLRWHCNNECSKRKVRCKYCGIVGHYEVISARHMTICEEYPVKCPKGCTLPNGIKRKDLAKHAEICPLEMVQCPFLDAGCGARILRKDIDAHMESNIQQHLMKMMMAYSKLKVEHIKLDIEHGKLEHEHSKLKIEHSKLEHEHSKLEYEHSKLKIEHTHFHKEFDKLSSQVAHLTLIEPVKLTDENSSFSFHITSSRGWTSPPFSLLDGYMFSIKHKEGKKASLMLLKGKYDDQLQWPMNLQYKLEIRIEEQNRTPVQGRRGVITLRQIIHATSIYLPDNLERVSSVCSKEIADIDLPEREILNYEMVVTLLPVNLISKCLSLVFDSTTSS